MALSAAAMASFTSLRNAADADADADDGKDKDNGDARRVVKRSSSRVVLFFNSRVEFVYVALCIFQIKSKLLYVRLCMYVRARLRVRGHDDAVSIARAFALVVAHLDTPVDPKPPAPRSVSSKSSTSTTSGVAIFSKINCATRSPCLMTKSSLP